MTFKLDLHGIRHHEVNVMVEDFIYDNQYNLPLVIICGNSSRMKELVLEVLNRLDCEYIDGKGSDYGRITVIKF